MLRFAIVIMAMVATQASAAGDQAAKFDLRCKGTLSTKTLNKDAAEPYESVYRLDLTAKKWCEGECKALFDIADVQSAFIVLQSKNVGDLDATSMVSNEISRETGKQSALSSSDYRGLGPIILQWEGTCAKEPFAGFPTFQTKF